MNNTALYAKYLIGLMANADTRSREGIEKTAREHGFAIRYGQHPWGARDTSLIYLDRDGVTISAHYYSSGCWSIDCAFTYKNKYYRVFDIDKRIDELIADGFTAPADFKRSEETIANIERIKNLIAEAKRLVDGRRCGELGDMLRSNGYFVEYDGSSCCTFSKDCLNFNAHYNYDKREWEVEWCNAFLSNGELTRFRISVGRSSGDGYLKVDESYEGIFGDSKIGHRLTEKDRVSEYKSFRVRSYGSRELTTLKLFKSFDDANKYAYETAKAYAEGVTDDRRRYAHRIPIDISDKYDYLAAYLWYRYDEGSSHFVFVQGEDEEIAE